MLNRKEKEMLHVSKTTSLPSKAKCLKTANSLQVSSFQRAGGTELKSDEGGNIRCGIKLSK